MHRRRAIGIALAVFTVALSVISFAYFRDNFSTHYPLKSISGAILRTGAIPWWNFFAGAGQPLAGNPNTLTFYPTTLLYVLLPAHVAFNLHFFLHLIAGWFALRGAAREFGAGSTAATVGATSYVLSGAALSTLSFYNLVPSFALVPAAMLVLSRLLRTGSRVDGLLLGSVCGLLGLAGEPVMILATAFVLGLIAAPRLRHTQAMPIAISLLVAAAIVAPLLIAYTEIAAEVERGFKPYSSATVLAASLRPARLLELITGPFLGLVTDVGPDAYRHDSSAGHWPLFLPIVTGGPLLLLAFVGRLGPRARPLKIASALLLFIALGRFNPLVAAVVDRLESARIVRYPEKVTLVVLALSAVLIALWIERAEASRRTLAFAAIAVAGAALLLGLTLEDVATGTLLRLGAGAVAALVTFAAIGAGRLRAAVAMHFLVLAFWAVRALPLDFARYYVSPSPLATAVAGRSHFEQPERIRAQGDSARDHYRLRARRLYPIFGVAQGVSYGTDRSPEGMYSYLSAIVNERMAQARPSVKVRYLRLLGVDSVVSATPLTDASLTARRSVDPELHTYSVAEPNGMLHPVLWPLPARSVQEAVARIESEDFDPSLHTIVPASADPIPSGRLTIQNIVSEPQRITFLATAAEPTSVVLNQSYFSGWDVTSEGRRLRIFPANIDRLGIVIPTGQRVVTVEFGRRRTFVAAAWVLSLLLLAVSAVAAIRSRTAIAEPAR